MMPVPSIRATAAIAVTAAAVGLWGVPGVSRADWAVHERATDAGTTVIAESFARSGDARLEVGCTQERLLYTSLEYLGYDSGADSLTVRYRVDGRNPIDALWPREPAFNALLLYNSNETFVGEFGRRVAEGNWLVIDVEVLPTLRFNLRGSRDAIAEVTAWCDLAPGEAMPPAEADGHEMEEGGVGSADEAGAAEIHGDGTDSDVEALSSE